MMDRSMIRATNPLQDLQGLDELSFPTYLTYQRVGVLFCINIISRRELGQ